MKQKDIPGMFDGPIIPIALKIAVPILIGNILQLLYLVVDTYFISLIDKSSTALISGTGLLFPLFFIFMAIGASLNIGISSLVGRTIGEKNTKTAGFISASGLAIGIIIAVPALMVGYLKGDELVRLLAGSELTPEALNSGLKYFYFVLPSFALMIIGQIFGGILQGEGLTKEIAKAMLLSTIVNIILDPIFIFGLDMGVVGAGLATTVSTLIVIIYITWFMMGDRTSIPISFSPIKVRFSIIKEIIRIGFPQFLNLGAISIAIMFLNKLVGNIGELHMNAWTLVGRMDQILIIPAISVSGATITMISQNYGRKNLDRILEIYMKNVILGLLMVFVAASVYVLVAPFLFPLFSEVPEVVSTAVRQVRLLSHTVMGVTVAIVSGAAFQGTGRPYPAIVIPIVRMGILTVPLAFYFVQSLKMGIDGVYYSLLIGNIVVFIFAFLWARFHLKRITFKAVAS